MRTPGSSSELEKCRRLAVQRVLEGHPQTEVARFLGVDDRNIRRWMKAHRDEGEKGLATRWPGSTIIFQAIANRSLLAL